MTSSHPQPAIDRSQQSAEPVQALLQVIKQLRHPVEGCPWDLKQTHHSLRRYLLEEAYETVEAISQLPPELGLSASLTEKSKVKPSTKDLPKEDVQRFNPPSGNGSSPPSKIALDDTSLAEAALKDELGDVLLQVALHSQLASERGAFDFDAVCQNLTEKLIRRHPHVFARHEGAETLSQSEAVVTQWAQIKQAEKAAQAGNGGSTVEDPSFESILTGVKKSQPALSRALETSQRAVKVGFAWPNIEALWACVMSEYEEFRAELPPGAQSADDVDSPTLTRLESEFGDILFATINLARQFRIDPEIALTNATTKFTERFQAMEAFIATDAQSTGQSQQTAMAALGFEAWDTLWKTAKTQVERS